MARETRFYESTIYDAKKLKRIIVFIFKTSPRLPIL